jgi:hypothetical protein
MIRALLHALGICEDMGAAYTVLRRDYEALWARVHELLAENAALRAEVHAHEDRQARCWALGREMRRDADGALMWQRWRDCCGAYLNDYADVLTPPEAEEDETNG